MPLCFHVTSVTPQTPPNTIREWLMQIDENKDGVLTKEELKRALHDLKLWCTGWKARWAVGAVDTNKDGVIDLNNQREMEKILEYAIKNWGYLIQGHASS